MMPKMLVTQSIVDTDLGSKMAKHYVIILAQGMRGNDLLLVLKNTPQWQNGRLNLPGGKVEEGETPFNATVRELKEETGYDPICAPEKMGEIHDGDAIIHCFRTFVQSEVKLAPQSSETELVAWYEMTDGFMEFASLIPNLRVIIPLMASGVRGWVITDDYRSSVSETHSLKISLPTYYKPKSE